MKTNLKRPCAECPFRRESAAGWLGPWQAEDLIDAVRRQEPFPCHKTIPEANPGIHTDHLESCAGAAMFLTNTCAISRDRDTAAHQAKLKAIEADRSTVFRSKPEFMAHHDG